MSDKIDLMTKDMSMKIERSKINIELVVENLKDEIEKLMVRWNRFKTDKELQNNNTLQQLQNVKSENLIQKENNEKVL